MIREIFIPQKIGNRYLIPQRIVSFDIQPNHVYAAAIHLKGTHIIIEQLLQQPITNGDHIQQTQQAIALLAKQLPRYNQVRTALSGATVIFKRVKLPFTNAEKIRQIIPYEIEPLLPFDLADAAIDSVITQVFEQDHSTEVLAIATQKKQIAQHLEFFENTGITPDIVSVDVLGLYNLYKAIPHYQQSAEPTVLIDLGLHSTHILYIYDHALRFIRTLPRGIQELAKRIGSTQSLSTQQSLDELMRFGVEGQSAPEYKKALSDFWQEVSFTITSFTEQLTKVPTSPQLLLVGTGSTIKGLATLVTSLFDVPCYKLEINELLNNPSISLKNNHLSATHAISIGIALPSPLLDDFNLLQNGSQRAGIRTLYLQLGTGLLLFVAVFGALLFHSYWQLSKLGTEAKQSEQEVISTLREKFPTIPASETNLEDVIHTARQRLQEQEKTWFAFSRGTRPSFLTYLLELFTRLDKKALGLDLEQLTLDEQTMTLKAEVKDTQALKILERDLRQSPLFEYVEGQENPNFTMKIRLATKNKGQQ